MTAGGKAQRGGVKQGDFVVAINGDFTEGLLHFDAQQMIKATGMSLQLNLSRCVCLFFSLSLSLSLSIPQYVFFPHSLIITFLLFSSYMYNYTYMYIF